MSRYYPSLNALRLYAALSVLLAHVGSYGASYQPSAGVYWLIDTLTLTPRDAVTLFFVLSGWLITALLLDERRRTGAISVRGFWFRRARRILPLYAVIVALGILTPLLFVGEPHTTIDSAGLLSLALLSAHVGAVTGTLGAVSHLWSIGVEEWFYAAWASVVRRFTIPRILLTVLTVRTALVLVFVPDMLLMSTFDNPIHLLLHMTRFEAMCIGAFGAWLVFSRHRGLRTVYAAEHPALLLMALLIVLPRLDGGYVYDLVTALVFGVVITCAATKPKPTLRLEAPLTRRLGALTYGLYMYHPFVILTLEPLMRPTTVGGELALYAAVMGATLALAAVSYRWFEKPILDYSLASRQSLKTISS